MKTEKLSIVSNKNIISKDTLAKRIWDYRALYIMLLPGMILLLVFSYGPIYGLLIAFKNFSLSLGVMRSPWVGFKHFKVFFTDPYAMAAVRNTIIICLYRFAVDIPAPIILAILINEIGSKKYKRIVQSITYVPHFISWIILATLITAILSPSTGVVNQVLKLIFGKTIYFMADPKWFRTILVVTGMLKGVGWGSIIYLAAISNVDPLLYEAAIVDGSTRLQRIRYITVPMLLPLISIILILSMGGILSGGFDQIFNMYNPSVYSVADIIDTYTYRMGIVKQQYSFATAVGFFKSTVGLIMVLLVNNLTKKISQNTDAGLL